MPFPVRTVSFGLATACSTLLALSSCSGDPPRTTPASRARAEQRLALIRATWPRALRAAPPASGAAAPVSIRIPERASEPVEIASPDRGVFARFSLANATDAPRTTSSDGVTLYAGGAAGGADVVLLPHARGVEDLVVFPRAPEGDRVVYRLDTSGASRLVLVAEGLEIDDAHGVRALRIEQPWIADARGVRRNATLDVESCPVERGARGPRPKPGSLPSPAGCTLVVSWDGRGLEPPLLLDPDWKVLQPGMFSPRTDHTATRLADGRVLVAGGFDASNAAQATAELFQPATEEFVQAQSGVPIGSLVVARGRHTATLLPGPPERVLLAGGTTTSAGTTALASAEIYDVATGTFTAVSPMNEPRVGHTATLLPDGRVLIAGGSRNPANPNTAEIFDPTTGSFALLLNKMVEPRTGHVAALLPSGKVLLAGGKGAAFVVGTAELFDPATLSFVKTADDMTSVRQFATATVLLDGRVLVAGGSNDVGVASPTADVYDPALDTFEQTGPMAEARTRHGAVLLESGKVLVTGGTDGTDPKEDTEIFDPAGGATGTFAADATMKEVRIGHSTTRLDSGKVLVAGGAVLTPSNSAELLLRSNGDPCTVDGECASDVCVKEGPALMGMCCDVPCGGLCMTCHAALQNPAPPSDGTCGPVADGEADTDLSANCTNDIQVELVCDGQGSVKTSSVVDCKPFACNAATKACFTSCDASGGCAESGWCDIAKKTCQNDRDVGEACGVDEQCASGHCVDGFCCETACAGSCQACDVFDDTTTPGQCVFIVGEPRPGHPPCGGSGECAPTCTGASAQCQFGTQACGGSSCEDGVLLAGQCDQGECKPTQTPCAPYACDDDGVACRTRCDSSDQCGPEYICTADGQCAVVEVATCDGSKVKLPNGESEDCAPYVCENAACRTSCRSIQDCVEPLVCDPNGRCVEAPPPPGVPSGCAASGREGRGGAGAWMLVALGTWLVRRRRRS